MERKEILEKLEDIFRTILDDEEELHLTEPTTANDVESWDSLSHIQIVVAVEKNFNVKFSSKEILSWSNIGEMIDSIIEKKG